MHVRKYCWPKSKYTESIISYLNFVPQFAVVRVPDMLLKKAALAETNRGQQSESQSTASGRSEENETTLEVSQNSEELTKTTETTTTTTSSPSFSTLLHPRSREKVVKKEAMKTLSTQTVQQEQSSSGTGKSESEDVLKRHYVVELAVFADPDLYEQLERKFPSNTIKKMTNYIMTLVNTVCLFLWIKKRVESRC